MSATESDPKSEVDFDRLDNEASKVFALWELMAAGDAEAHPAAAPATEARTGGDRESWAATTIDAPTLRAMESASDGGGAPDRTLEEVPRAVIDAALATAEDAPSSTPASPSTPASMAASARSAPLNLVPFPEPAEPSYAMDELAPPLRSGTSPAFWLAAAAGLVLVGGLGLAWLMNEPGSGSTVAAAPAAAPAAPTAAPPAVAPPAVAPPAVAPPAVAAPISDFPRPAPAHDGDAPTPTAAPALAAAPAPTPAAAPVAPAPAVTTAALAPPARAEAAEPATPPTHRRVGAGGASEAHARPAAIGAPPYATSARSDDDRHVASTSREGVSERERSRPASTTRSTGGRSPTSMAQGGRGAGFVSDNPY
jgi:hypothetical protein